MVRIMSRTTGVSLDSSFSTTESILGLELADEFDVLLVSLLSSDTLVLHLLPSTKLVLALLHSSANVNSETGPRSTYREVEGARFLYLLTLSNLCKSV